VEVGEGLVQGVRLGACPLDQGDAFAGGRGEVGHAASSLSSTSAGSMAILTMPVFAGSLTCVTVPISNCLSLTPITPAMVSRNDLTLATMLSLSMSLRLDSHPTAMWIVSGKSDSLNACPRRSGGTASSAAYPARSFMSSLSRVNRWRF